MSLPEEGPRTKTLRSDNSCVLMEIVKVYECELHTSNTVFSLKDRLFGFYNVPIQVRTFALAGRVGLETWL